MGLLRCGVALYGDGDKFVCGGIYFLGWVHAAFLNELIWYGMVWYGMSMVICLLCLS